MSARGDRGWMYKRRNSEGLLCSYCQSKVNEFLNFAFSIERVVERKPFGSDAVFRIKCPCSKCKIKVFKKRDEVKFDLWHNGFIRGYTTWYAHGERKCRRGECSEPIEEDNVVGCTQMILDIHNATYLHPDTQEEQAPNSFAKQYYEMLEAHDKPLYDGFWEALLGGPVQYRWMYLYERKLGSLKRTVRNKARVEGSIVQSYLLNELSMHCSLYFDPRIETRLNREPRNFAPDIHCSSPTDTRLNIFKVPSRRLFDTGTKRNLTNAEKHKAHTYILLNCEDVHPFLSFFCLLNILFDNYIMQEDPYIDEQTLDRARDEKFAQWFKEHIQSNGGNKHLNVLAQGPMRYKFHTLKHGDGLVTHNSGVCVKGSTYNEFESDYYGLLVEVLEVNYHDSNGRCVVVLFKCDWFEPIQGVRVNRKHNLVDIKYKSKGCQNDPFILASQAEQVYYAPYPSMTKDLKDWWAVVKATPRSIYEVTQCSSEVVDDNVDVEEFFQENEMPTCSNTTDANENTEIEEVGDLDVGDAYMEVSENEEEFVDEYDNLEVNEAEEEFIDRYDDSDDENKLALSDHSSDEDEVNLSDHSLNDYLLIIINWTHYEGIMARDNNSKGRGRGRSGNGGIIGTSSASDNGRRSTGRGRGISGNIVIGGNSNVSRFGNQEDGNYDNGSRSGGSGRGISGNIGIGGSSNVSEFVDQDIDNDDGRSEGRGSGRGRSEIIGGRGSSNVSRFGNQEDANYDNGSRSEGRGRGISGNIGIGGSSSNVSGFGNQEDANYDNGSRSGGRGRGISGNIGIGRSSNVSEFVDQDVDYDDGRSEGKGRGRGRSEIIGGRGSSNVSRFGIGGSCRNVSGFGNQEEANYDNGSRIGGRGRGIGGNIGIGGGSNVSRFCNQDADYDNGSISEGVEVEI
ncbi:hypothetical protein Tco_0257886 [Tanacetum coccineum]